MLRAKLELAGIQSLRENDLWRRLRRFKVPAHLGAAWRRAVSARLATAFRTAQSWRLPLPWRLSLPWPIAAVLCLGVGLSFAAFFLLISLQKADTVKAFEAPAQEYAISISKDLDRHLEVVKSAAAFFKASSEINRWEFFQFARDALPRHPGIQAIEWVPRVRNDQRTAYEDLAQNDGLFGFRFLQMTGEGLDGSEGGIEAGPSSEHFPIYFVEPFNGNETDLGRDLATDADLLAILTRSRDSGHMVVAPPRRPAAPVRPAELVVLQPVYATRSVPTTKAERAEFLLGFVRGVLHLGSLAYSVRPTLGGLGGLDVHVFRDEAGARRPLHHLPQSSADAQAPGYDEATSGLHIERRHAIANEKWSIVIVPAGKWRSEATRLDAWLVLLLGLLLTAMLLQHLIIARNRTRAIEEAVVLRTSELRQAMRKVEEASRAKSDFLAMVGHELRTPLNAINGFSEVMAAEMFGALGDPRYREYVEEINASGNHLLSLINDILDLTTLESDDLDCDRLSIGDVVQAVCAAARGKTEEAGLELTVDVAADLPLLLANEPAAKRILDVLLSNATKFTPAGGGVTVTCATGPGGGVVIEVADNGIGIAPEAQKRIFRPFTQNDQSLARRYEGTGLGLALALRLVELHGGALELDSQLGQGTSVRVIFPAERSLAAPQDPSASLEDVPARSRAG